MAEQAALGFAGLLRQLRAAARLTQEELAEAAGLSPRSVSDLERGVNRTARRDTAELLAGALGLAGPVRALFVAAARGRGSAAEVLAAIRGMAGEAAEAGPGDRHDDAGASNVVWMEFAASRTFVDRNQELGVLREAWSEAVVGHRVLALIAGEPGMGKTALAAELARLVHAGEGLVLYGRWNEEVLAPYQAFREALGEYARACPAALLHRDVREVAGEIARLFPELGRQVGVSAAPHLSGPEADRFRLFESLDTWIQRMASRRPVLLVLDDLQWADRPSLLLLLHLVQAPRSTPVLTVAMYRDVGLDRSELPALLPSLVRDTDRRRVPIRGLDRSAIATLLEATTGRVIGERDLALVGELERETAGNPFFLLEMTRHLSRLGAFDKEAVRLREVPAEIPDSVRDLVRWRLARLSGGCAAILSVASVAGERFDASVLGPAASMEDDDVLDRLEEAARAGLIAEIGDAQDWWRFSHSLARRVIADELSESRRARLHQRIGHALESRPGAAPAELAHHFGAAAAIGSAAKAVRYERLAGMRASGEAAAEVAVRHYRRALELLDRFTPEDEALRGELALELADAHDRAGEYPSRDERFAEAADSARRLGRPDLFVRAALGYGGVLPAMVRLDVQARALLDEALEWLGEEESGARALVLARLNHWLHAERPYRERLEFSDRSVVMARRAGDRQTLAAVLLHRGFALDGPDDVGDALQVASEILDIGAGLGRPELTLEGLRVRLAAEFERGAYPAAAQTALALNELADQVRHPEFIRLAAMWDVTVASLEGRFEHAEKLSEELNRRLQRIGHPQAALILVAQTFSWRWLQGRAAEYLPIFEALSAAEPANLVWRAVTVWCLAEGGARDRAAALLGQITPQEAAAADKNYLWWAGIVGLADAADLLGDRHWARILYDLAAPYAGNTCTLGVVCSLGAADHWLGVLAAVTGRFAEAAGHLEAALQRHHDMASRPLQALTEEAYSHVLSARGEPADIERAAVLRESAMRIAGELGLAAVRDRVRLRG
jgi:transcriptional regulator with XRE-family HTH domain